MAESGSKMEQYLLLARTNKGAAAAKIVSDATSAPGIYTFSELLSVPNVQALQNDPSSSKSFTLLQLFAYGTLETYRGSTDVYPALNPAQLHKLKQLTLVSLALRNRSLTYDTLLSSLDIASTRDLEDLVIDTIYAGLLSGKMHHHEKILHVDTVSGRDLKPQDLLEIQRGLQNWCSTATTLLEALDQQIATIRQNSVNEANDRQVYQNERNGIVEALINMKETGDPKGLSSIPWRPKRLTTEGASSTLTGDIDMDGAGQGSASTGIASAGDTGRKLGVNRKGKGSSAGEEELTAMRGSKRFKDSP